MRQRMGRGDAVDGAGAGADLFGLTLMHMHQGKRFFLMLPMSFIVLVHQVKLISVHQVAQFQLPRCVIITYASGRLLFQLRPWM